MTRMPVLLALLCLADAGALWAQQQPQTYPPGSYPPGGYPPGSYPPGSYPPGNYPPNTYPGGGGMSIPRLPWPRRKSKEESAATQTQTLVGVEGRLRRIGPKELLLELKNKQVLRFRLIGKTRFRNKAGEAMRESLLNPGDQVQAQVSADDEETAQVVTLMERGGQRERTAADKSVDEAAVRAPRAEDFGKPKDVAVEEEPSAAAPETAAAGEPAVETKKLDDADEMVIAAAREAALQFTTSLPNYLAQQVTTRYFAPAQTGAIEWQPLDLVTADLAYSRGREEYRNVQIDGRPTSTAVLEKSGMWSNGEFGITLEQIMGEAAQVRFRRRAASSNVAGRPTFAFDFAVSAAQSQWTLVGPDQRKHNTAYTGTVWIDRETRRVLRIEQRAQQLPRDFAYSKAESILQYGFVTIDGQRYLLPASGENIACISGGACNRNVIEFRNYRKFGAETKITF